MKNNYCKNCIYKAKFQNGIDACGLNRTEINLEKDFCSKFKSSFFKCSNCNCLIPDSKYSFVVEKEENEWLTLCPYCLQMWLND